MQVKRRLIELFHILISSLLVFLLTFSVWFLYRGNLPMPMQGVAEITFWEFIDSVYIIRQTEESFSGLPLKSPPC
jgi:hypothetical protein